MASTTDVDEESYETFIKNYKEEVMVTLKKTLPRKALEITKLLESDKFALSRKQEFRDQTFKIPLMDKQNPASAQERSGCGLRPLATNELIPDNPKMKELWQLLSPYVYDLAEITNNLRAWLALHAPKFEDGDNVGVEIQEKVMTVLSEVEKSCFDDIEGYRLYNRKRGESVEYALKYPNVGDYLEELRQLDEMCFLHIRCKLLDTRRMFIVVQDTVLKNMDKLRKPKSVEVESLYSM